MLLSQLVNQIFLERKNRNSRYSLRAFSRDLKVHPGRLSEVMAGKKLISLTQAKLIMDELAISSEQREKIIDEMNCRRSKEVRYRLVSADEFASVWNWQSFVVRRLPLTKGFQSQLDFIKKRTGLATEKIVSLLESLKKLQLIEMNEEKILFSDVNLRSQDNIPSNVVKDFHRGIMRKVSDDLNEVSVESRDVSSLIFAVNKSNINEARKCIEDFRNKMVKIMSQGEVDEIYTLNVQLFPLTKEQT